MVDDTDGIHEDCYDCGERFERATMYRDMHPIFKYVFYRCEECFKNNNKNGVKNDY